VTRLRLLAYSSLLVLVASDIACNPPTAEICDITRRSCQESIYQHLLSLRGDGFGPFDELPPVTIITEDEFRQQLLRDEAEANPSGDPNPFDKALDLLHFTDSKAGGGAGSSTIDDQATHVYAFYDPVRKAVTIVSHPTRTADDPSTPVISLAHELVHFLQDRQLDLRWEDAEDSDSYLAYDAIIEGDATFYELLFANDLLHLKYDQTDIASLVQRILSYNYAHFEENGTPLFAAMLLVYPLGGIYEANLYQGGGNAAVRHGYAKAPRRTVGLLLGSDGKAPPVGPGVQNQAPAVCSLPINGDTAGADQFGALLLYTFLRGWNVDHDVAYATARTWTGDFLRVQASPDLATTAVAWRIEVSTPPPASVVEALRATGELSVTTAANSLTIEVSDPPTGLVWEPASNCR